MIRKILIGIILLPMVLLLGRWGIAKAHRHFAYAYFEARCEADGGEFIYKSGKK